MTDTIIARFQAEANQWTAYFENRPNSAFGHEQPIPAVRRLLEGAEAAADTYTLHCDHDIAASGILIRPLVWDPPELLIRCPVCEGTGEYVGLFVRETCATCGGRTLVLG